MSLTAWEVLGIAETEDARAIKRAYASALKRQRPEQDPAAFQLLTDAFEWACGYARHREHERMLEADAERAAPVPPAAEDGALPELGRPIAAPAPAETQTAAAAVAAIETGVDDAERAAHEVGASQEAGESFAFAPFFDELSAQLKRASPRHTSAWLEAHPALYSLELKWALIPHVFNAVAENAGDLDPTPGHIRAMERFFGIDTRLRRHPAIAPALDYLDSEAWRKPPSTPLPDGWNDLAEVMERESPPRKRKPESRQVWIGPIILIFWLLLQALRNMTSG